MINIGYGFFTPLPANRLLSPSRSSTASCSPVLAPLGTALAQIAVYQDARSTRLSDSPRESKISRPECPDLVLAILSRGT